MPTYEFSCNDCGHLFEDMVSMPKRDLFINCPKCMKQSAHRTTRIYGPYGKVSGSSITKMIANPNDGD